MRHRNFSRTRGRDNRSPPTGVTRVAECARDELLRAHRQRAARVTLVTSRGGAREKKKYTRSAVSNFHLPSKGRIISAVLLGFNGRGLKTTTKFRTRREKERRCAARVTPWLLARRERTAINGSPVHCVALGADPRHGSQEGRCGRH